MFELENEIKWDPLCSEAKMALLAINGALFASMDYIIIEGDTLNVIDPIQNSTIAPHWTISNIIKDINAVC